MIRSLTLQRCISNDVFSWAVSTVAAVEAAAYLSNSSGFSQSLSFQQLISCDTENLGCDGGNIVSFYIAMESVLFRLFTCDSNS